jgi:hypothetical protein
MSELEKASSPRPHRPGDPLADLRGIEETRLDHAAVHDFTPTRAMRSRAVDSPMTLSQRGHRLRLARNLVLIVALLTLMLSLLMIQGVNLARQTDAVFPNGGWIVAGALILFFSLLMWAFIAAVLDYVRVREVVTNAALAASFDELGDLAAEMLGGSLSVYTGRLTGEALGNMALTLRLARRAVDACRPLKNPAAAPYHVTLFQLATKLPTLYKRRGRGEATSPHATELQDNT